MGMKRVLEKEEFEAIQKPLQTLYKEADGKFVLELDDYVEPQELLDAKKRETKYASDAKEKLRIKEHELKMKQKELEDYKASLEEAKSSTDSKVSEVDNKWKKDFEVYKSEQTAKEQKALEKVKASTKQALVSQCLSLFKDTELASDYLENRIQFEVVDGEVVPVFLDGNKNKIEGSIEDFKKNLVANPKLQGNIKAVQSSGGSASSTKSSGSTTVDFGKMTGQQHLELAKSNPELYQNLFKKHNLE
jgi:hypothetical protein